MNVLRKILSVLLLLALFGCARPVTDVPGAGYSDLQGEIRHEMGDVLEKYVTAQQRLIQVAGPLFLANASLCPRRAWSLGFVVHSDFDLPQDVRYVAYERLLLDSDPRVLAVIPGSDAWLDGVRPGDTLLTMNGRRVRNAADARIRFRKVTDDRTPVTLGLIRDGQAYSVRITPRAICNYRLVYEDGNRDINASATGTEIHVTQGMMDFTSDDELAVIVGHELAHNIMHHQRKQLDNAVVIRVAAGIIDGLSGVMSLGTPVRTLLNLWEVKYWSPRFEKEADYVGLYLVARAGGNLSPAAPVWRRMAAEHGARSVKTEPQEIRSHPATAERFVVLSRTQVEIEEKRSKGQDLMPNLSGPWVFGQKYRRWDPDTEDEDWIYEDLNH